MPAEAPGQEQFGYLHFFYVFIYFLTRALTYELLLVLHFSIFLVKTFLLQILNTYSGGI